MMNTFFRNIDANNLDTALLLMVRPEYEKQEMVFRSNMIEKICIECQYPYYQFAHNLEGDIFMRMKMRLKNITMEYIVMKDVEGKNYNSYVHQIFQNGQVIYRRPDKPIGKIYLFA